MVSVCVTCILPASPEVEGEGLAVFPPVRFSWKMASWGPDPGAFFLKEPIMVKIHRRLSLGQALLAFFPHMTHGDPRARSRQAFSSSQGLLAEHLQGAPCLCGPIFGINPAVGKLGLEPGSPSVDP